MGSPRDKEDDPVNVHVNDQADGQLSESGGRWQLRFVRRLAHPQDKVWRALTVPGHRDAWFPQRIEADSGRSSFSPRCMPAGSLRSVSGEA